MNPPRVFLFLFLFLYLCGMVLYNPFEKMTFGPEECFLTGQPLSSDAEQISVFPEWILNRYELHNKTFTMLGDGNIVKYSELKLPCAASVIKTAIDPLEKEIETAFSAGYDEVKNVPEERLFQWMSKLVYGILFHDFNNAIRYQVRRGERFTLSDFLKNKFTNLHLMLQSLTTPITFNENPWTIEVVKIRYSKDVFNYKDETNNLNFSLGMNGFGIVACLQDNGENKKFHKGLMEKISDKILHPVQFEELCGRFIYSNYLLQRYPEYKVNAVEEKISIEALPFTGKKLFNPWDDEMYGQVLANYWKPWGLTMNDIVTFPNPPISFLISDYSDELIEADAISLPY